MSAKGKMSCLVKKFVRLKNLAYEQNNLANGNFFDKKAKEILWAKK